LKHSLSYVLAKSTIFIYWMCPYYIHNLLKCSCALLNWKQSKFVYTIEVLHEKFIILINPIQNFPNKSMNHLLMRLNNPSPTCGLCYWPKWWTHYKIGKLNMWTLFCNVCINFLNSQIWKEFMLELNGKPSSVTTSSTDFSFQYLIFWNLFEFSAKKYFKINISHSLNPNLVK
jgi:hypothetical protein